METNALSSSSPAIPAIIKILGWIGRAITTVHHEYKRSMKVEPVINHLKESSIYLSNILQKDYKGVTRKNQEDASISQKKFTNMESTILELS